MRVGLLGFGRIASSIHLPVLSRMRDVAVISVAEPDETRRRDAAIRTSRSTCFANFGELLKTSDVDAVVITLPNALHASAAAAAFSRGLHVYVEKPLASNLGEGRQVVDAWRRAGTVGMIGFNYRFLPAYQRARELIAADRIGRLVGVRSVFSTTRRSLPEWKQHRDTGGGALLDLASHHLDLATWLVNAAPRAVSCDLQSRVTEDDTAVLQVELSGGISAQIFAVFGGPEQHRLEILGERGALVVDPYGSEFVDIRAATLDGVRVSHMRSAAKALASPRYWLEKINKSTWQVSYERALGDFVRAARSGGVVQPDLAAGCETLEWIDAARESAREGRRVPLGDALL